MTTLRTIASRVALRVDGTEGLVIRCLYGPVVVQSGAGLVDSVNGQTGVVVLDYSDVGAAATAHTHSTADLVSGTVATARLGSGTADSTKFLRGDQTWATPASGINYPANSILANNTGLSAPASGLSRAQIRSMLAINMEPFRVRTNDYILLSRQTAWGAAYTTFSSTASNSNNQASYTPFYVAERIGIDTLSLFCYTANAGAGACIRMGIHADNDGRPGSVVLDAGTAGIGAPGLKSVTFTETFLDPGLYWYVVVVQNLDTGTNPAFVGGSVTSATVGEPAPSDGITFIVGRVSGALAANPVATFDRRSVAKVFNVWARVSTPS